MLVMRSLARFHAHWWGTSQKHELLKCYIDPERGGGPLPRLPQCASRHIGATFIKSGVKALVLCFAVMDVAVDAWALWLLRGQRNEPFASTAQTVGLSLGNGLAFPLLLAMRGSLASACCDGPAAARLPRIASSERV